MGAKVNIKSTRSNALQQGQKLTQGQQCRVGGGGGHQGCGKQHRARGAEEEVQEISDYSKRKVVEYVNGLKYIYYRISFKNFTTTRMFTICWILLLS